MASQKEAQARAMIRLADALVLEMRGLEIAQARLRMLRDDSPGGSPLLISARTRQVHAATVLGDAIQDLVTAQSQLRSAAGAIFQELDIRDTTKEQT